LRGFGIFSDTENASGKDGDEQSKTDGDDGGYAQKAFCAKG
jgi:hypothetical protein